MAILSRPDAKSRFDEELGDTGYADDVVEDAFGTVTPDRNELGEPHVIQGADGRGASSWVPIIEWATALGPGLITAAAWDGIKLAVATLRRSQEDLKRREVEHYVSLGAAIGLAIGHLVAEGVERGYPSNSGWDAGGSRRPVGGRSSRAGGAGAVT